MSISDELAKLADLREKGILSPEEFEQAKKKVLSADAAPNDAGLERSSHRYQFEDRSQESFGKAANRYVTFQIVMAVIGITIFLVFFAPIMCNTRSSHTPGPNIQFNPHLPR